MLRAIVLYVLLVLCMGCTNTSVQKYNPARAQLEALQIPFDNDAFVEACQEGKLRIVQLFLEAGMDPGTAAYHGRTALIMAARHGRLHIVNKLLNAGADPNARRGRGLSAVFDRITYSIDHPEDRDLEGATPLIHAAHRGHPAIVEALLQAGADPSLRSADSTSALMAAFLRATRVSPFRAFADTTSYHHTAIRLLRDAGAVEDVHFGLTPLMLAALLGEEDTVRLLLHHGADPNATLSSGHTTLMAAALSPGGGATRLLLDAGAVPREDLDRTALQLAVLAQNEAAAIHLLEAGSDPNRVDERGASLLYYAAFQRNGVILRKLLESGADATLRCNDGSTVLLVPALRGYTENVRMLLAAGADPNVQDERHGASALIMAVFQNQLNVVRVLLDAGADPLLADNQGKTATDYASQQQSLVIRNLLTQRSASSEKIG